MYGLICGIISNGAPAPSATPMHMSHRRQFVSESLEEKQVWNVLQLTTSFAHNIDYRNINRSNHWDREIDFEGRSLSVGHTIHTCLDWLLRSHKSPFYAPPINSPYLEHLRQLIGIVVICAVPGHPYLAHAWASQQMANNERTKKNSTAKTTGGATSGGGEGREILNITRNFLHYILNSYTMMNNF